MRKQLVSSVEKILNDDINTVLLLGDIGVLDLEIVLKTTQTGHII